MLKKCGRCKEYKEKDQFFRAKEQKDGLRRVCKKCSYVVRRSFLDKNPEVKKQYEHKKELLRRPYIAFKKSYCEQCGFIPMHACQLDVDHIDGNHKNNDINNLRTLCSNCHRLKTYISRDHTKWRQGQG